MRKNNLVILLLVAFFSGAVFTGLIYSLITKNKGFLSKVKQKIERKRIDSIPPAKEPLIISDFENEIELGKWEFVNADVELTHEHCSSGASCLKVSYGPGQGASAAKIEKYFSKNKSLTDWSQYEVLKFNIYNPSLKQERLILQIKDTNNNKSKINLTLEPNTNNLIEVDIRQLWDSLKVSQIANLNLFLWDNDSRKNFYLDDIKLIPSLALNKKTINIINEEFLPRPGEDIYKTGDYFAASGEFKQIPLVLINYLPGNATALPFSGGIPFGRGQLRNLDNLQLVDGHDNIVPFQMKTLSKWPDKSIKWALLDFKAAVSSPEKEKYYLRSNPEENKSQILTSRLSLIDNAQELKVNTGAMQFSINKSGFYLFDYIWLDKNQDGNYSDDEMIASKVDMVLSHNGKEYHSALDKKYALVIEEKGRLKVCLQGKGWFVSKEGDKFCQFITRIYAYEGESYLKIQHTFVYTGYPENKAHYLYKGKRLPRNETIEAISINIPLKIGTETKFTFAADDKVMQGDALGRIEFTQKQFNSFAIKKDGREINAGSKLAGWLDLSSNSNGITVGIKNFWQQFPKGFRLDSADKENQCILISLWPKEIGGLDLKTIEAAGGPEAAGRGSAFGLAKTHEIYLYLHREDYANSSAKSVASAFARDILVTTTPQWISSTRVLGRIWPYDRRLNVAEEFLSRLFDWGNRQIENFGWYGMIDFGDTLSWYRKEMDDISYDNWGWHPEGRWGWFNCEAVGTHTGALLQFFRTGEAKYFIFGANLAQHIMDIDTCHYNTVNNDKRVRGKITDVYSQVGSMHRHNANHWGGRNEEAAHTNVLGLIMYYYITGDARARDVINEVGSFFINEKVTYFSHPDIAPQRSIANVLWGDVLLYEFTGDEKYKKAADKLANLFYAGQKSNGAWSENYNPVKQRWDGGPDFMYMQGYTLPALIAYHQLTGNKAIAESIIKATEYVMKHEEYQAYFDATAYCYWLTGERKYLDNINKRLDFSISHQQKNNDPLWDGMIYKKAYFARVMEYLYKIPFALEPIANAQ